MAGDQSGQFITVTPQGCYDSNCYGHTVNNGFLNYLGLDNNIHVYSGESYWGQAYYFFDRDYQRLNIKPSNGNVTYVYDVGSAPASITTSSKIKFHDHNAGTSLIPVPVPDLTVPENRSPVRESRLVRKQCTNCNGSGINPSPTGTVADYTGQGTKVYCQYCREYVFRHSHGSCPECRGKGYVERREY